MSINYLFSPEANAKFMNQFDKLAYDLGQASVLVKSAADKANIMSGELYASSDGALLLSVPNSFVRGAFDTLEETGLTLPYVNGRLNAHVVVMTPEEVKQVGGTSKVSERGHRFNYNLGGLRTASINNSLSYSRCWFFSVGSQELSELRKTYGLSATPGKHGFHIVLALRKTGVFGNNDTTKHADDKLKGGLADNKPDSDFDKTKLEEAAEHEQEHVADKQVAKEIAKDHLVEDSNYYRKLEKIEKLSSLMGVSDTTADVITPAPEDMAFIGGKVDVTPGKKFNNKDKFKVRKAVVEATKKTLGVDPTRKIKQDTAVGRLGSLLKRE